MVKIFYRSGAEILFSQSETELSAIGRENVIWIDMLEPTGEQKRYVEQYLGTEIQSRAEAEEIESSSRYSEENGAIFANTNFLSPADDEMLMDAVSFILVKGVLTTIREIPLRSLNTLQMKMQALPDEYPDGNTVFVDIMDRRVDLDADIVELISQDVTRYSRRINQNEDISEDFLLDINQLQQNAMNVRANMVDKQRLLSNLLKSKIFPKDAELRERLGIILQDIASLVNHISFTFERLEYMQETVIGIINLDQNRIMKVFTFVSILLMPATLVASFYGMNVSLPMSGWRWAWLAILAIMFLLMVAMIWYFFKRKKML
ncbi:MAG TPA: magnesium and cobalt transport protein CorA [Candidatus Cryptobacteroides merdipullorum]|uniref:Magnesium and cobalt transport protein CorA n=1 Tax=Candidatus Cryptobacteroides merdipullorum TaxID=2840771 RepID=A0A9D1GPX0_9BACT|nr:magnesium and cobalt transport protein CorA [Candidatus Cryptobacteroides merdipullorum]